MEGQDKTQSWLFASVTLVFIPMILNFWIIILCGAMIKSMDSPEHDTFPYDAEITDDVCRLMLTIFASSQTLEGPTPTSYFYFIGSMALLSFVLGMCYACFLFCVYSKERIPRQETTLGYPHKRRVFKFSVVIFTLMILLDLFGVMTSCLLHVWKAMQQEDNIGSKLEEFLTTEEYSVKEEKGNIWPLYITGVFLNIFIVLAILILPVGLYTEMMSSKPNEQQRQHQDDRIPYVYDPSYLPNRYQE